MVLTEKGFARPTFDDLLSRQTGRAKQLFGEDTDTSGQSVLGKFIRIGVHDLAECYELLEDIYYARFPNSARGQSLDRLCSFTGVVRDAATASKIRVRFGGNPGAVIKAGFLVSCGDLTFYADRDYSIGADGHGTAYLNCTVSGTVGNLAAGAELGIVNPGPDLEGVTFQQMESHGREKEGDTSLRLRFGAAVSGSGSATMNAIRGAIARVPLVGGVTIVENDTPEPADGRPPHSFECYVLAPESQNSLVASAIFDKKPLGIRCVGTEEVRLPDDDGKEHIIRFSRTREKAVYIRAKVTVSQFFETEGISQIKGNLMEYINNLANGEPVYLSGLFGYIHGVHGVVNVQELLVSGDGEAFNAENIRIEEFEIARTGIEKMEIEVVA